MPQIAITAVPRSDFGKGAARRTRRAGLVFAVIYGRNTELRHVSLPGHELTLALRKPGLVLEVTLEGVTTIVAPRDVQRDPVRRILEHIDLVVLSEDERVARLAAGVKAEAAAVAAAEASENFSAPSQSAEDAEVEAHAAAVEASGDAVADEA